MRIDEKGLDDWTDRFAWSAWRYETSDVYDVATDEDGFDRYLAGEPCDPGFAAGWHEWLRARRDEGKRIYRVRVLYREPSPYLCFEMEWGYAGNAEAGEEIRVLDLTEQRRPDGLVDDEFWMLDADRAAVMIYDDGGRFLHADTTEGRDALPYVQAARAGWGAGEPFSAWWARHPQWHRAAWLGVSARA